MTDNDARGTYRCPDCDAMLVVLYTRNEFNPPMVTGWCSESDESKSVPKGDCEVQAGTEHS